MKLLAATAITLSLFASAFAQTNQAEAAASPGVAQAPGSQSIRITRGGSQPSRKGPAENFTGSVRVAPKLAELTDDVLYGDVWERPQLSKRDRSLVTVAALIALNRPDHLRSHLVKARENGVTEEELIETITHLAFYAGWPNAVTAIGVAREVFEKK